MIDEDGWHKYANDGDGRFAVACALLTVARAIDRLGTANAATPMGAIELLSSEVNAVARGLGEIAGAIEAAGS